MSGETRRRPTSYYVESSGIGRLLRAMHDRPVDVGVVGLGTGTIAAYGKPGDRYHFFEIDPCGGRGGAALLHVSCRLAGRR